ncbi:MAG: hypothetical protein OHK0046_22190 [Anaerolineae bacterium]
MNEKARQEAEAFKNTVAEKIERLINEFASGKLSREQFQVIYDRYSNQLEIAEQAIKTGSMEEIYATRNSTSTVMMRDAYEGKATGLKVYHHKSGTTLETLGKFNAPMEKIQPRLDRMAQLLAESKFLEDEVERIGDNEWVLFVPGRFTIIVTLFLNEPSEIQIQKIAQLNRDFEKANRNLLEQPQLDGKHLAYPFTVFVDRR